MEESSPHAPAFHGGGDIQFRSSGDSKRSTSARRRRTLEESLPGHHNTRGLKAALARASVRDAETPLGPMAGKRRPRSPSSAPLDPKATVAEIEEGYKRALRLGESIDRMRMESYEMMGYQAAWLSDESRAAYKVPRLTPTKLAMADVDLPSEGKENVPRRRYSPGDMFKGTTLAGTVTPRSGRHSLAQASDLATPTSADASLSDNDLITTVVDNPLATPANQFLRQLDAADPSPAHEFPFSHPTPARSGSELSSPARSTDSAEALSLPGTPTMPARAGFLQDDAAAVKSPLHKATVGSDSQGAAKDAAATTAEELPQADNECTELTPASGRQRLQQLLQTTPVTPAAVRKAKRSWLPGAAAVLFKLVLTALVFGAWWLHPTCMGSQFASAAQGARSGAAMLPLGPLFTYKAAVVRAAPPETPPGLWSKFARKAEQIGISASRPLAEAVEKRAPPAAILKPTPQKKQPLAPAAAILKPTPQKKQPLAPAAAIPKPTPQKKQPLAPPKPPTIKAEQKASLPQAAVSSKPARAPAGAKAVARPPKPADVAAHARAAQPAPAAPASRSLATFAVANWLALLMAPAAAASLLLAYVAAARLSAGHDEAEPSTLSTPPAAAQSPSVRVTRARSASLAKADSEAPSSPSNKSASGPAASAVTASMATVGRSLRSASKAVSKATTALVSASGATSKQQRNAADEGEVESAPATARKGARAAREAKPTPARRSRRLAA